MKIRRVRKTERTKKAMNLTLDPVTIQRGRIVAEKKGLSVSGWVEEQIEREFHRSFGKEQAA